MVCLLPPPPLTPQYTDAPPGMNGFGGCVAVIYAGSAVLMELDCLATQAGFRMCASTTVDNAFLEEIATDSCSSCLKFAATQSRSSSVLTPRRGRIRRAFPTIPFPYPNLDVAGLTTRGSGKFVDMFGSKRAAGKASG